MSTIPVVEQHPSISDLSVELLIPAGEQLQAIRLLLAGLGLKKIHESAGLPDSAALQKLIGSGTDIFVVDLNANDADRSFALIETLCSRSASSTVMACSAAAAESSLMLRSMRAGAREFLVKPIAATAMEEALDRALARHQKSKPQKAAAKVLVFAATKGGAGATTIATNFAVALAEEGIGRVVGLDLDVQLGEMALGLGLTPKFSIKDALQNIDRLDSVFLMGLLAKHTSGLYVLAAPEEFASHSTLVEGLGRLLSLLRDEFDYIVIDAGPIPGVDEVLFDLADTIYLVTQASIPALRNARRILMYIASMERSPHPEVILNRCNARDVGIDETGVVKALARPVNWKVPNDFAAVRTAENTGVPVAMKDSPITRVLRQMARSACGKPVVPEKKSKSLRSLIFQLSN
ncbi:MAG: AAA family ATPase [Bryobacteraceae bacterium]